MSAVRLTFARQARAAAKDPGPFYVLPMMPALLMTVVFTALFDRIADVSGPPGWDYDEFLVPGVVVLVALLGAGATSASLAADLQSGYFDRLRMAPIRVPALLAGRLAFEAVRLVPGAAVVLAVGFAFGASTRHGVAGPAIVVLLVALLGVAYTGLFFAVAIRTRDPQTPFTLQPLGLPLAFLSSALVPIGAMPGWAEQLARINPVSVVVDGARTAMLEELWSAELAAAIAVLVAWTVLSQLLAWKALTTHLARS
jgi:ABC-type multidrug transport system permease subunit